MCCHTEAVADLKVHWLSLVVLTKREKTKDYCNLEGSSQWEDFLVVEASTDHAAFMYLVVAGLVLVCLGREQGMAGVTLHASFCSWGGQLQIPFCFIQIKLRET